MSARTVFWTVLLVLVCVVLLMLVPASHLEAGFGR